MVKDGEEFCWQHQPSFVRWFKRIRAFIIGLLVVSFFVLGGINDILDFRARVIKFLEESGTSPPPNSTATENNSNIRTPSSTHLPSATSTPIPLSEDVEGEFPEEVVTLTPFCHTTGTPTFSDDFSDNVNNWVVGDLTYPNTYEDRRISNGRLMYSATFLTDATTYVNIPDTKISDFHLSFIFKIIDQSDDGSARLAIVFRNDSNGTHYRVRLANDGRYSFNRRDKGTPIPIIGWTSSPLIKISEGDENSITVLVHAYSINVCINGQEIFSALDSTINFPGNIGIGLSGSRGMTIVASFDNVSIINLQDDP